MFDNQLWVEKYRPKSFDEYVWSDPAQRQKAEEWVKKGYTPNLLLCGKPGCGKTSLAKMLLDQLDVPSADILYIKASNERRIDELQDRINQFTETYAFSETGIKYVILDEADSLSQLSQKFLRSEMELDSVRFILTCNYENKIIEPLHSRLQTVRFSSLNKDDFIVRCGEVLALESVDFEIENLMKYVDASYPDLRKCIGTLEQETLNGSLKPYSDLASKGTAQDYLLEAFALFKTGNYRAGREIVIANASLEEYVDIFRWFYSNLDLWETPQEQDQALLIIRKALVYHSSVADPEINLAAMLVELSAI